LTFKLRDDIPRGTTFAYRNPPRSGNEINGLGESFSGSYYIVRATHTFGTGGYETEFSVRRNAVS